MLSRCRSVLGALHALFSPLAASLPLCAIAVAQLPLNPINNSGLQGDQFLTTPGGWVWPASPAGNPQDATPYNDDKIQLGKALFWDEQVSSSSTMACGTCHIPDTGGVDPRPAGATFNALGQPILGSNGVIPQSMPGTTIDYGFTAPPSFKEDRGTTPIHVPTHIGAYVFNNLFWDMRAGPVFNETGTFGSGAVLFPNWAGLENQAQGPPTNDIEMGHQNLGWSPLGAMPRVIEDKLNKAAPLALVVPGSEPPSIPVAWLTMPYEKVFDVVFAADPDPMIAMSSGVTRERFAMALAAFMRTQVPDAAPIDRNTMTRQQLRGFQLFVNSGCPVCHSVSGAPSLIGGAGILADRWDNSFSDGNGHDIFAANPARSIGRIKTPTLRNVGLRSRFFHDGRGRVVAGVPQNTLADIVDFYDIDQNPASGGFGPPFELIGFTGPNLTVAERAAVIAFLSGALTDPRVANGLPPFDRPKMFTDVQPFGTNVTKPSTGALGGWKPVMIGDVPPLSEKIGGPNWWKVGVGSAGAGAGGPAIPTNSTAILYMGTSDTAGGPFWLVSPTAIATLMTTPEGFATAHTPFALTSSTIGMTTFLQWVVIDPTFSQLGFSESAVFTIF